MKLGVLIGKSMTTTQSQSGFSTLELLIAFAVLTLSLVAVIMVVFGNQASAIDTELSQRALYITQTTLEEAAIQSQVDFSTPSSDLAPVTYNTTFDTQTTILPISVCAKEITATTFWNRNLRNLSTSLSSVFVDLEASAYVGDDCATTAPEDDWDNPGVFIDENISGQSGATSLDEFEHFIYLTTKPTAANKEDFFIYEFDESTITLTEQSRINLEPTSAVGLNEVDVSGNFAYLAVASTSDQVRVLNISNPAGPIVVETQELPGVDPLGSYPEAFSIYFHNDFLYVGTKETDGHEFHIFSVDTSTGLLTHEGSLELTHNVNDIMVVGNYAYLATSDNNHELMVIDVSNPASLEHPDTSGLGFDVNTAGDAGTFDGYSVYVIADRVYLGRVQENPTTANDLFILDRASVIDGSSDTDGLLGAHDVTNNTNAFVGSVRISGRLAFVSMDDPNVGLVVYDVSDPTNIVLPASCSAFNFSENSVGLDIDKTGTYVFSVNKSNAEISIIHDQPTACIP